MGRHADVRVGLEVRRVDLGELEEDLRRARVPPHAELHHPPYTGDRWQRIDTIPDLAHALDTPEARLAAHMLRPARVWLTAALACTFLLAGALQLLAGGRLSGNPALLHHLSVGWESTLVDGAWWSGWTAPFVHHSFAHLLGNLVILAYCGHRCERAVGATGLLCIGAGAAAGAAMGVIAGSEHGAVGASGLAFGFWGGQFAIGWRYGAAIPEPLRRFYGAGTLWVAIILMAWSFLCEGVTFAGHLGGFAGGCAAVLLLPVATSVPPSNRGAARARALLLSLSFGAVVPLMSALAPHAPALMLHPSARAEDARSGLGVQLPWRLRGAPWSDTVQLPAAVGSPPLSLAVVDLHDPASAVPHTVIFHDHQGLRVSWNTEVPINAGRKALYERIAASASWNAPAWVRPAP